MKFTSIIKPIMLFCFIFSLQVQAQYQIPSQERVETLLEQIDNCKRITTETEQLIETMEANPESYSLKDYNSAKELLERAKSCINISRGELDSLRKKFPGWFNSPNATMQLGRGNEITPRQLEKKVNDLDAKIRAVLERFNSIDNPDD